MYVDMFLNVSIMIDLDFSFSAALWEWTGKGKWVFVTLPEDISADIKHFTRHTVRGFRTVRVTVKVDETTWQTSLFPDSKRGAYLLPVKKAARVSAGLAIGDTANFTLSVAI